jgi:outer membrane protein assembly factor BamB
VGPAGAGDVVVAVDAGGGTVALDAGTGRPLWSYAMRSSPSGTPAILGDRVVLSEAGRDEDLRSRDTRLTVHDLRTGRYLGSLEPPGFAFLKGTFGATSGSLVVPVGTGVMIVRPQ